MNIYFRWNFTQDDWECRRLDGDNLIDQFLNKSFEVARFKGKSGKFVDNRQELLSLNVSEVDYLLGKVWSGADPIKLFFFAFEEFFCFLLVSLRVCYI
jgi:hypothetical protein